MLRRRRASNACSATDSLTTCRTASRQVSRYEPDRWAEETDQEPSEDFRVVVVDASSHVWLRYENPLQIGRALCIDVVVLVVIVRHWRGLLPDSRELGILDPSFDQYLDQALEPPASCLMIILMLDQPANQNRKSSEHWHSANHEGHAAESAPAYTESESTGEEGCQNTSEREERLRGHRRRMFKVVVPLGDQHVEQLFRTDMTSLPWRAHGWMIH
jgi:hypothetical protein